MELAFAAVTLPLLSKAGFSCGTYRNLSVSVSVCQTMHMLNSNLIELNVLILFVFCDSPDALAGLDLVGT